MKAALRKKDETANAVKGTKKEPPPSAAAAPSKATKRKALAEVGTDENVPPGAADNEPARPAKRARTSPTPVHQEDVEPKLQSDTNADAQVLRPAMRARKKYHAKGRTSSPATEGSVPGSKALFVDYDALPSPPRASTAAASSVRSTPPRKAKTKAAEAKAAEAERDAKKGKAGKADASDTAAKVKAEKVEKAVAKPKAKEATKMEKVTKPEKLTKVTENTKKKTKTTEEVEKKAVQDSEPQVVELDAPAATTAPRGRPRPRRVGAAAAKDKAKEVAKEMETKPESPGRAVRTSARAAAAAEKRRAQEEKQRDVAEDIVDGIDTAADLNEDVPMDFAPDLPVSYTHATLARAHGSCPSPSSTFRHRVQKTWNRPMPASPRKHLKLLCVVCVSSFVEPPLTLFCSLASTRRRAVPQRSRRLRGTLSLSRPYLTI